MEIKHLNEEEMRAKDALQSAAGKALEQIKSSNYAHGLEGTVLAYGAAFHSKTPYIISEKLR